MKILVGMSGGVDSTYAAYKLKSEGHTVEGAVLLMHEYTDCDAAVAAAESVGIPLHIIDSRALFEQSVIPNFISEYTAARTPNPCIICNGAVKFRALYDFAVENGFDRIATGHYAECVELTGADGPRYALKRAVDGKKDQTYMLWRLSQDILSMLYLPLGAMTKEQLRYEAGRAGLFSADREDSQEICFIPSGDYAAYIEAANGPSQEGNFVDKDGNVLGKHKGIIHYTVGQRKGLGIALGARAFITDINPETNEITLSTESLERSRFEVVGVIYSGMTPPDEPVRLDVKVRYQAPLAGATVTFSGERATVELDAPARSVTDGQSAVFYKDGVLVAGGFIRNIKG